MKQISSVNCFACGKEQLTKDEVGISKKLLGRKIKQFFCLHCLAGLLDVTTDELIAKIEEFKDQGCVLFER
jgi:uncharacterized protein YlaI